MVLPNIRVVPRGVPFSRDPLSVLYDDDAGELLDRFYAARMTGGIARTIAYIDSPPLAARDDYDGSLTVQERAFKRAVHWNLGKRRPRRSVRFNWADEYIPGLGRPVTISMFTLSAARKYSETHAAERPRWVDNPELRSGGYQ